MKKSHIFIVLANVLFIPLFLIPPAFGAKDRPNIIIMLSDNVGYGELGSYGGGIIRGAETPRLDKLAAEGIRFTNFNTEVECTPSRSALLTGRYPYRSGTGRAAPPGLPGGLAPWEITIAELLSEAGYDTAIYGKWHLGNSPGRYPTDQGFDEWWGFPFSTNVSDCEDAIGFDGSGSAFSLLEGKKGEPVKTLDLYSKSKRPFIDEIIVKKSLAYIQRRAESENPFFLFIPWSAMHHPYLPHPDFKGKSTAGDFGDMMVEHDYRVGQVLDAVDAAGISEQTIVFYISDNGPDSAHYPVVSNSGSYRGFLGSAYEGAIRTPAMVRWPKHIPRKETNELVTILDIMPTLAKMIGLELPKDRAIDGKDMSSFLLGKTNTSGRESFLIFSSQKLLAVKWRQYKIYFTGDDPSPRDRVHQDLWAPRVFNVEQDPREEWDISMKNTWIFAPVAKTIMPFAASVKRFGVIEPGAEERTPKTLGIPFFPADDLERSFHILQKQQNQK